MCYFNLKPPQSCSRVKAFRTGTITLKCDEIAHEYDYDAQAAEPLHDTGGVHEGYTYTSCDTISLTLHMQLHIHRFSEDRNIIIMAPQDEEIRSWARVLSVNFQCKFQFQ